MGHSSLGLEGDVEWETEDELPGEGMCNVNRNKGEWVRLGDSPSGRSQASVGRLGGGSKDWGSALPTGTPC